MVTPVEAFGRYQVRTCDGQAYDETDAPGALGSCWLNCRLTEEVLSAWPAVAQILPTCWTRRGMPDTHLEGRRP
jgi:hypothetical protein